MRLESLSTFIIDRLVFRKEPKDKHVIRLSVAQDKEWFKSYSEDAPIELPPSNSSELVKLELLDMAIEHASTKKPAKLEHKYDDDFMWAFKELVKSNDLQWSNKYSSVQLIDADKQGAIPPEVRKAIFILRVNL